MERGSGEAWMELAGERGRKKRFSDEQIKSLESMFGSETKLDPRKKQQLARELGMQPRQVAIWFQNKRARWKSKQLEREYGVLRADYEDLRASYELLKKEKQMLSKQHQMLIQQLEEPIEEKMKDCDSSNPDEEYQRESPLVAQNSDSREPLHSFDSEKNFSYNFREEETELYLGLTASDISSSSEKQFYLDPSLSSDQSCEKQFYLDPSLSSDQSCNNSQWWEFWPI